MWVSVTPDQCEIPDCSSAALCSLSVYKDLVGGSTEHSERAGKTGSIYLLLCKISSTVVHDRIRIEAKSKTVFTVGQNQLLVFLKSSHFGSIGLRTLELFHCVRANYFIADLFHRDLILFNWYLN